MAFRGPSLRQTVPFCPSVISIGYSAGRNAEISVGICVALPKVKGGVPVNIRLNVEFAVERTEKRCGHGRSDIMASRIGQRDELRRTPDQIYIDAVP